MTPKDLVPQTIQVRLVLMHELLQTLEAMSVADVDDLRRDAVKRLAVERILTQLVDLAVSINQHVISTVGGLPSSDYKSTFDVVGRHGLVAEELGRQLRGSVGLRNVLVHDYLDVDLQVVYDSIPKATSLYGEYVKSVSRWLSARASS